MPQASQETQAKDQILVAKYCQHPPTPRAVEAQKEQARGGSKGVQRMKPFGLRAEERQLEYSAELSLPPCPAPQQSKQMAPATAPAPGTLRSHQPAAVWAQALAAAPCAVWNMFVPRLWVCSSPAGELPTGDIPASTAGLVFFLPPSWCLVRHRIG